MTVVDNLSKRVPSSALRELFDHFGGSTLLRLLPLFDFGLRKIFTEQLLWVLYHRIDGFVISVSTAKYTLPKSSNPRPKVFSGALRDSRSYIIGANPLPMVDERGKSEPVAALLPNVFNESFNASDKANRSTGQEQCSQDIDWLKRRLIGNIKKVYSLEMVQKALLSENIKCKVCPWGGPSSILAIGSSNDLEDVWE
ncbi:hypothetical protein J1N35_008741 [Gossypium stocksii]|uniref:Uncharacterized protein n=1 Tax=Gossypium stocksii TaxID=47602 RepID=A0A9D4AGR6_9ROSI|nr:hypothetical protein J1N35_008741 [Gossypium stocksii]